MSSRKFSPKVGDLVYFRWEDHCSYDRSGWQRLDTISERLTGSLCETVGFVVEITRGHITTVAHITINEADGKDNDGSQLATRLRRAIISGKIIKRFPK